MLDDFLPAIICIAILVGAVLFGWISDHPRIRRYGHPEFVRTGPSPRNNASVVSRSRRRLNRATTYLPPQLRCISNPVLGSNCFCPSA